MIKKNNLKYYIGIFIFLGIGILIFVYGDLGITGNYVYAYECSDTDPKTDVFVRGKVISRSIFGYHPFADRCRDNKELTQYNCRRRWYGYIITNSRWQCPGNSVCENGICVEPLMVSDIVDVSSDGINNRGLTFYSYNNDELTDLGAYSENMDIFFNGESGDEGVLLVLGSGINENEQPYLSTNQYPTSATTIHLELEDREVDIFLPTTTHYRPAWFVDINGNTYEAKEDMGSSHFNAEYLSLGEAFSNEHFAKGAPNCGRGDGCKPDCENGDLDCFCYQQDGEVCLYENECNGDIIRHKLHRYCCTGSCDEYEGEPTEAINPLFVIGEYSNRREVNDEDLELMEQVMENTIEFIHDLSYGRFTTEHSAVRVLDMTDYTCEEGYGSAQSLARMISAYDDQYDDLDDYTHFIRYQTGENCRNQESAGPLTDEWRPPLRAHMNALSIDNLNENTIISPSGPHEFEHSIGTAYICYTGQLTQYIPHLCKITQGQINVGHYYQNAEMKTSATTTSNKRYERVANGYIKTRAGKKALDSIGPVVHDFVLHEWGIIPTQEVAPFKYYYFIENLGHNTIWQVQEIPIDIIYERLNRMFEHPLIIAHDYDDDTIANIIERNEEFAGDWANGLTDWLLSDTDGDEFDDNVEIEDGTDPTDPDDYPGEIDLFEDAVLILHLDDEQGETFDDDSGEGNDGSCSEDSCPTRVDGRVGEAAYEFDGNDYINFDDVSSLRTILSAGSVGMWFKLAVHNPGNNPLIGTGVYIYNQGFILVHGSISDDGIVGRLRTATTLINVQTEDINDEDWHYITLTWGANGKKIYLDGDLIDESDNTQAIRDFDYMHIGKEPARGYYFEGSLDEVVVWAKELTAEEVSGTYQAYSQE